LSGVHSCCLLESAGLAPCPRFEFMKHHCKSAPLRLAFVCMLLPSLAHAQVFSRAFEHAKSSEPNYLSTLATQHMASAKKDQAYGAFLPQVSMSATSNSNTREYETRDTSTPVTNDHYNSASTQLTLNQGLIRLGNLASYQQAKSGLSQAQYQVLAAEQELLVRFSTAWFDAMSTRDMVTFTEKQMDFAQRKFDGIDQGLKLGSYSEVDWVDAKSKLSKARADFASAKAEQEAKLSALEQLMGETPNFALPELLTAYEAFDPTQDSLDSLIDLAQTQNPSIQAAQWELSAAQHEIDKQNAGHLPTLDLVGNYGKNSQSAGNFPGQNGYDINQKSFGFQLNIPLYSGGTVTAKQQEAHASKEKAQYELEAAKRNVRNQLKQAWHAWFAAKARTQALADAVAAAKRLSSSLEAGQALGSVSATDTMQAQLDVYNTEKDWKRAQYDQILNFIKVKSALGWVDGNDLRLVDCALASDAKPETQQGEPNDRME
jgi:outer membrane protein